MLAFQVAWTFVGLFYDPGDLRTWRDSECIIPVRPRTGKARLFTSTQADRTGSWKVRQNKRRLKAPFCGLVECASSPTGRNRLSLQGHTLLVRWYQLEIATKSYTKKLPKI